MMDDNENVLPDRMRRLLRSLYEHIVSQEGRIAEQDLGLKTISKEHEACNRLMEIPGVGPMTSTILPTMTGAAADFKNGRQFAAYLGLVPRQYSTDGKQRLLGITKRGDSYARTLLVREPEQCSEPYNSAIALSAQAAREPDCCDSCGPARGKPGLCRTCQQSCSYRRVPHQPFAAKKLPAWMPREEESDKMVGPASGKPVGPPGRKGRSGEEERKRGYSIRALPKG